jgi:hypothetical protein
VSHVQCDRVCDDASTDQRTNVSTHEGAYRETYDLAHRQTDTVSYLCTHRGAKRCAN